MLCLVCFKTTVWGKHDLLKGLCSCCHKYPSQPGAHESSILTTPRVQRHNVDKATVCFIFLELLRQYVDKWKHEMNNVIFGQDGQYYKVETCIVFGDWGRARRPARKCPGTTITLLWTGVFVGWCEGTPFKKRPVRR